MNTNSATNAECGGLVGQAGPTRIGFGTKVLQAVTSMPLTAVVVLALAGIAPAIAQDDPEAKVESLRNQLEQIELNQLDTAFEIDAQSADLEVLTRGLASAQMIVTNQSARLVSAQLALESAELEVTETSQALIDTPLEIQRIQTTLRDHATATFIGKPQRLELFASGDPITAIREKALTSQALGSEVDLQNTLVQLEEDLVVQQVHAAAAIVAAERLRSEAEAALAGLEADQNRQAKLLDGAEQRLDHLLGEREGLAALGSDVTRDLSEAKEDLIEWLAGSPDRGSPPGSIPPIVPLEDIEDAGKGVLVHKSIRKNVEALLKAAAADGVDLAGGGYRSSDRQIELRKKHCGTSHFAIYEMRASKCSPPTARPGKSKHERGLAIDFTYNGNLITRRSGPGWEWLKANAAAYGLKNLPSEPWHFSIDGT